MLITSHVSPGGGGGKVAGPILFNNALDNYVDCTCMKFPELKLSQKLIPTRWLCCHTEGHRLDKQDTKNLMKFNRRKHEVLYLTWSNSWHLSMWKEVVLPPSLWHWWCHTQSTISSSGLHSTRQAWTYWKESIKGPLRQFRNRVMCHVREVWTSCDCSAWRREDLGILSMRINTSWGY